MARPGLTRHRKFLRLAHELGSVPHARGYLEMIWDVAYESGDDLIGDAADVEIAAQWSGESGALASMLARIGFLDEDAGRYRVHDLWHHCPDYVTSRREREGERRKEKLCACCGVRFHSPDPRSLYCSDRCKSRAWRERTSSHDTDATPSDTDTKTSKPAPDVALTPTDTDATRTNTDRHRSPAPAPSTHHTKTKNTPSAPRPAQDAGSTPDASPVFAVLPCVGGRDYEIRDAQVAEWRAAFPGIDVASEILRAVQWIRDNPTRRKTWRGARKYIGGWLGRAQDRSGGPATRYADPKGDPSTVRIDPPTRYQTRREKAEAELAWARRERAHIPGVVEQHERVLADLIASGRADETVPVA